RLRPGLHHPDRGPGLPGRLGAAGLRPAGRQPAMSARDGQKGDGQKGDGRNVAAQTRAEESAAGSTAPRAASAGERAPRTFESDANRPPSGPELAGGEAAERPADASPELLQEQAEAAKP